MNHATIDIVTPSTAEPVSLVDMLAHLRIDVPDDSQNAVLLACVSAARQHVEQQTGRVLVSRTLRQRLDAFPPCGEPIVLLRVPVVSVSGVTYVDEEGDEQTLVDGTDYIASASADFARVGRLGGTPWPTTRCQPGAATVTYVAGYGLPTAVPADLLAAIKLLAAAWFETRGDHVISQGVSVMAIPRGVDAICRMNRASLSW